MRGPVCAIMERINCGHKFHIPYIRADCLPAALLPLLVLSYWPNLICPAMGQLLKDIEKLVTNCHYELDWLHSTANRPLHGAKRKRRPEALNGQVADSRATLDGLDPDNGAAAALVAHRHRLPILS